MEVVSTTLYVTVEVVEHSLIPHLVLTVVQVESLVHLPHWVPLSMGTTYYIWVAAVSSDGLGSYSDIENKR